MFVRYYLELDLPAAQVEQALLLGSRPGGVAEAIIGDFLDRVGEAIGGASLSEPGGPATMDP